MTPVLTANDYVQDGLIFQLDGIERGDNPDYWKDLKSTTRYNIAANEKTNQYVNFPPPFRLNSVKGDKNSTIEIGIKYRILSKIQDVLVQNSTSLGLQIQSGNIVVFQTQDSSELNATSTSPVGKIITIKAEEIIMDGVKLPINRHRNWNATNNNYVGGEAQIRWFEGHIYSIRVYNRKLTDDEILYNQRVENLRFNRGLNLNGGLQPYTPGRALTMSRDLALDEASPLESFDEPQTTEQEECVVVTER